VGRGAAAHCWRWLGSAAGQQPSDLLQGRYRGQVGGPAAAAATAAPPAARPPPPGDGRAGPAAAGPPPPAGGGDGGSQLPLHCRGLHRGQPPDSVHGPECCARSVGGQIQAAMHWIEGRSRPKRPRQTIKTNKQARLEQRQQRRRRSIMHASCKLNSLEAWCRGGPQPLRYRLQTGLSGAANCRQPEEAQCALSYVVL
jgi:hypothetical protein